MPERKKLNLELNKPTIFELLYDVPAVGNSRYGNYYLYSIKNGDNKEYSFFATADLYEKMKMLKKGDKVEIAKVNEHQGNKILTKYDVKPLLNSSEDKKDNFYDVMLKSFQDALKIQSEVNGMIDVNRTAITLFIARAKLEK